MNQTIITGDCLEVMKTMEAASIDCIVTDPPYGLKFMGKEWDHGIPGKQFWVEALKICKPGAHLLAFGGTRTYHRLTCAIEDAGWEIRDCLMWLYGSGFPKSHNHFGLPGYGTALKPAYEPIIMALKPCDGTYKQNAGKWDIAGINIDECRIGTGQAKSEWPMTNKKNPKDIYGDKISILTDKSKGRWPANILLDEEAAQMLDEQSGILKSGSPGIRRKPHETNSMSGTLNLTGNIESGIGDSGGASRFFYCAKASSSERGENNTHPTVKPLSLMQYLIKLVMPPNPNAVLLDPFAGSGTTILSAKQLNRNAIGIEISGEYAMIARKRIEAFIIPSEQYELNL